MPHTVQVNDDNVVLPDGNLYQSGEQADLTDEQYYQIDPDLIGGLVTVVAEIPIATDEVT